jgi:2'-5' RNA ligase
MNNNDAALLRGWIQGVAWGVLGELYLEDVERTEVMRFVRQLRKSLAAQEVRLGLDDAAPGSGNRSANFDPHVTIGIASKDYLKKMLAESFDVFTFSPAGVSVYQLGNFGTARKQLKAWN